jgi:hypothetical protein
MTVLLPPRKKILKSGQLQQNTAEYGPNQVPFGMLAGLTLFWHMGNAHCPLGMFAVSPMVPLLRETY